MHKSERWQAEGQQGAHLGFVWGLCAPRLSSCLVWRLNGAWRWGFRALLGFPCGRGLSSVMVRAEALTVGGGIANGGRCGASRRGAREGAHVLNAGEVARRVEARARGRRAEA